MAQQIGNQVSLSEAVAVHSRNKQIDGTLIENGVQAWVYEEEVFSAMSAIWWCPDSLHFAYLSSDETLVPQFLMSVYDDVYPTIVNIAYPKVRYSQPVRILFFNNTLTAWVPESSGFCQGV